MENNAKVGVLGTDLTTEDVTKYVVAKLTDKEDGYEIICVLGNNEDFYPICIAPLRMAAIYSKDNVNRTLSRLNGKGLPVFTCEISHNNEIMTLEHATQLFFDTTEAWEIPLSEATEENKQENETPYEKGEYLYTIFAIDDEADFCTGIIKVSDDTTQFDIEEELNYYSEALLEEICPCQGEEYDTKQLLEDITTFCGAKPEDVNHLSVFFAECFCKTHGWQWKTIVVSEILDAGIQVGMRFMFNTEDDTDLYPRNGELVTVVDILNFQTSEQLSLKRLEKGYRVRFSDGYESEVYKDELHSLKEEEKTYYGTPVTVEALGDFDVDGFMEYMKAEFPEPMNFHFTYDMLKNMISFLLEQEYGFVQIANILHRIIPVKVEEVLQYCIRK